MIEFFLLKNKIKLAYTHWVLGVEVVGEGAGDQNASPCSASGILYQPTCNARFL